MPPRNTLDEAAAVDVIMSPPPSTSNNSKASKNSKNSKHQRDPPADPPGIPADSNVVGATTRSAPRRTQSDTEALSPEKPRSRSRSRTRRRKSSDGEEMISMLPPLHTNSSKDSSDNNNTKSGGKKSKSKKAGGVSRTHSATDAALALPPKSPVKRSQSGSIPKSPGILKPSSYTVGHKNQQQQQMDSISAAPLSTDGAVVPVTNKKRAPSPSRSQVLQDLADQEDRVLKKIGKLAKNKASSKAGNNKKAKSTSSLVEDDDTKLEATNRTGSKKEPTKKKTPSTTPSSNAISPSLSRASANTTTSRIRAPSPRRDEIRTELAVQEENVLSKTTTSSQLQQQSGQEGRQTPGAYLVQGQNVARAPEGMLSPQEPNNNTQQRRQSQGMLATSTNNAAADSRQQNQHPRPHVATDLECAPPVIAGSIPARASPSRRSNSSNNSLVVAAELSTEFDIAALVEQQVQQRLAQKTVRANVVSVSHGKTLYDPVVEARRLADLKEMHKPRGMREKLFGDARNAEFDIAASPDTITKRVYLKWTVKRNPATNLWVASVQTSQKAAETNDTIEIERNTLSFPAATQQEAFETGLANATPLLHPTEQHPICNVCKAKFALFRRPTHCRNCGVCVCSSCATNWPCKMLPESYNTKSTSQAQVCLACDFLANSFRDALIDGDFKKVLHLYSTGNINLRTPCCIDRKAEVMYVYIALFRVSCFDLEWLGSTYFLNFETLTTLLSSFWQ